MIRRTFYRAELIVWEGDQSLPMMTINGKKIAGFAGLQVLFYSESAAKEAYPNIPIVPVTFNFKEPSDEDIPRT